ncbi:MAG: patatin-like phospholipase family protein [Sphingobacteriales bacterium JAD_PAG50586_3]|nr:MAG: patatin-like phospholipase family protein [Sphingobacteriales bacterium JAD_PAG50586_3]
MNKFLLLLFVSVLAFTNASSQRVGVVLSGGGALGIAHIGVLKALEENNIPIDYIAGTSMGALVGGMYAAGWSPDEILKYMASEDFSYAAQGKIKPGYVYYFKRKDPDAGGFSFKFSIDSIFKASIPTNVVSPKAMDFALMEHTAGPGAAANYNYDSLYIPFRCVAADVEDQKEVVFRNGNLADGMRTSASFPFYFKPISVNGRVLFDGGLYNNFPSNVMYDDFFPDYIIGSNVAGHGGKSPDEDNLFSQIRAMLMTKTNYGSICDNMVLIEPEVNIGIFDFSSIKNTYDIGYYTALTKIDTIKMLVKREVSPMQRDSARTAFKAKQPPLVFENIYVNGLNRNQNDYIMRSLSTRNKLTTIDKLRGDYFRLVSDDQFKKIYPRAKYNYERNIYDLYLDVKQDRDIIAQFGGCFSSKPINTAFLSLEYKRLGKIGQRFYANAYFGKFYGSVQAKVRLDYPTIIPFYFEADFTLNSFDYFTSRTSFFEDVQPSYLFQSERSFNFLVATPVHNKGKLAGALSLSRLRNEYYQTGTFTIADTTDRTFFNTVAVDAFYEESSLNRKQYAFGGSYFLAKLYYIFGQEEHIPGSTSFTTNNVKYTHSFLRFKVHYENYFNITKRLKLGIYGEAVVSNQPEFSNYTSTLLIAPAFQPIPESSTLFLRNFRAFNYGAVGGRVIVNIFKRFDFRLENYLFMPYKPFVETAQQTAAYGKAFSRINYMGSGALVYDSPIGPISLSGNYYQREKKPWSLIFTLGYIIFNRKANQ